MTDKTKISVVLQESASLPAKRLAETGTLAKCLAAGKANAEQARRGITVETAAPMLVRKLTIDFEEKNF